MAAGQGGQKTEESVYEKKTQQCKIRDYKKIKINKIHIKNKKLMGTDPRVTDFDDEVGDLEAVFDGAGGGSHMAGEPVDVTATFGESHFS